MIASKSPIRVLHVEDVEWDARAVRFALDEVMPGRCDVTTATSLAAARAALAAGSPDVILLDLNLPDSSGLETVSAVRKAAPGIPLVVLTGLDDDATGEQALAQGAQDYLAKSHAMARPLARALRYAIERGRARAREAQLEAKLVEVRREAMRRDALTALGTVVMGVAHEVNNPLTSMSLGLEEARYHLDALAERATEDDQRKIHAALEGVHVASKGITRLTTISRALDRLRGSDVVADEELIDLARVAADLAARDAPGSAIDAARVKVEAEPAFVRGSREDFDWLLCALIRNSLEATGPTGGSVRVRTGLKDGRAFLEVTDHGSGIARQDLERLFVPFFTTKTDHVGLSLARAYRIARACGGRLYLADEVAQETTFRFEAPAQAGPIPA